MISAVKISCILLVIVLINLTQAKFSEVPPPPKRPEHFHSREELLRYIQKLHEYYSIVGRWRLRRGFNEHIPFDTLDEGLFKFFDINNDHLITNSEFAQRLKFQTNNK